MTTSVVAIVEGDGEGVALSILMRRLNAWQTPDKLMRILPILPQVMQRVDETNGSYGFTYSVILHSAWNAEST